MIKRFLPEDLAFALRSNALGLMFFVTTAFAFAAASWIVLTAFSDKIDRMAASSWVNSQNDVADPYVPGERYDLSEKGVQIPPARDDRLQDESDAERIESTEHHARDCYQQAHTAEASDLCAQWANAAAVRYGNLIALESFRLNTWIGFITAFGILLAAVGVVFAGMASYQASRGIRMMAFGFMPALSFSVQHLKPGWAKVTVKNIGTGPARAIHVQADGERVRLDRDRLGAGAHTTFKQSVGRDELVLDGYCVDLAKTKQPARSRFIWDGSNWRVADEQPDQNEQ